MFTFANHLVQTLMLDGSACAVLLCIGDTVKPTHDLQFSKDKHYSLSSVYISNPECLYNNKKYIYIWFGNNILFQFQVLRGTDTKKFPSSVQKKNRMHKITQNKTCKRKPYMRISMKLTKNCEKACDVGYKYDAHAYSIY